VLSGKKPERYGEAQAEGTTPRHSMDLMNALIELTGFSHSRAVLTCIFGTFCGENALSLQSCHFSRVEEETSR
jgi:hypothetical protein